MCTRTMKSLREAAPSSAMSNCRDGPDSFSSKVRSSAWSNDAARSRRDARGAQSDRRARPARYRARVRGSSPCTRVVAGDAASRAGPAPTARTSPAGRRRAPRCSSPPPTASPIAATTQIVAADVSPVTMPPRLHDRARADEADAADDLRRDARRIADARWPSTSPIAGARCPSAAPRRRRSGCSCASPAGLPASSRSKPMIAAEERRRAPA